MNNPRIYKLAVVPKVPWYDQYAYAYGSQHDYFHTKSCLKKICNNTNIEFRIIYLKKFKKIYTKFDGVIFIGLSNDAMEFLSSSNSIDKYTWSFNQIEWVNRREIFKFTNIIFEQSTRDLTNYYNSNNKVIYTPLAFQGKKMPKKNNSFKYDIVFNGTLDRSRRLTSKTHRRDIILGLLENGYSIVNFNGRAHKPIEKELLIKLKKFKNFKVVNKFGSVKHYSAGKYSLHIPFHELGSEKGINLNWGMTRKELEDTNWLNNWDIYRCIGARANIITFDCAEIRSLGLDNTNCSFYKSDPSNIDMMVKEISEIVDTKIDKLIDRKTWQDNTYMQRWKFIIKNIMKDINFS